MGLTGCTRQLAAWLLRRSRCERSASGRTWPSAPWGLDLVGHDGGHAAGEFAYTLLATDRQRQWTEVRAVPNRGQKWVFEAATAGGHAAPVRVRLSVRLPSACRAVDGLPRTCDSMSPAVRRIPRTARAAGAVGLCTAVAAGNVAPAQSLRSFADHRRWRSPYGQKNEAQDDTQRTHARAARGFDESHAARLNCRFVASVRPPALRARE